MYKTITTVPAVAVLAFVVSRHNQVFVLFRWKARRNIPVVKQILQTQYKTYDIIFERNKVLSTIENIAHEQIKY